MNACTFLLYVKYGWFIVKAVQGCYSEIIAVHPLTEMATESNSNAK